MDLLHPHSSLTLFAWQGAVSVARPFPFADLAHSSEQLPIADFARPVTMDHAILRKDSVAELVLD